MSANAVNLSQLVSTIPVRRKLVDQSDRDKFEWNQWQSATKAMNNIELAAKEKHLRNLILGTFRLEGSRLFWSMIVRIHVESHPILGWKFCYVVHRLLREGHQHVIADSILLSAYFDQLCRFWSRVPHSYGPLAHRYCHFIISKLKFHARNPMFTGNLTINGENINIQRLFSENWNLYNQLCIELFDYMEELLNLVQVIFISLDQSRTNSMTTAGQCRLTPLIICIQDSSLLYDYIVKILFKLHEGIEKRSGLSSETLQVRLTDQFRRLKRFYAQSSTLQYFQNLIKVPNLPENPPNFNLEEGLKNYQTAVAVVNSSKGTDEFLLDLPDNSKPTTTVKVDLSANGTMSTRAKEIFDLEQRLMQYETMLQQNRSETDDLHRTIAAKDAELITERNHRLQTEEQLRQQSENQKRLEDMHAIDNKTNNDEKFHQLREEHLAVLRQESDKQKQFADLTQQFLQLKENQTKRENQWQQNSTKLNENIFQLRQTNDELQARIEALTSDYQSITISTNERMKEIEHFKQNVEEHYKVLENDKAIVEKQLKATEVARGDLFDKNREHEEDLLDLIHEKEILEQKILDLEQITRKWAQKYFDTIDKQNCIQINHEHRLTNIKTQYKYLILNYSTKQMQDGIDRKKHTELFNGIEYLSSKLQIAISSVRNVQDFWKKQNDSDETATLSFFNESMTLANCMTDIVVHEKTRSNFDDGCLAVINECIDLFTNYQILSPSNDLDNQSNELITHLNQLLTKTLVHNSP